MDVWKAEWSEPMNAFHLGAKRLKDEAIAKREGRLPDGTLDAIHAEYREIVSNGCFEHGLLAGKPGQRGSLKKSKGHNLLLRLHDFGVP